MGVQQVVPTLFEFCAWFISSEKNLLESSEEWLADEVLDQLKAVQMLVGLWGVKFFSMQASLKVNRSSSSNRHSPNKNNASPSHDGHYVENINTNSIPHNHSHNNGNSMASSANGNSNRGNVYTTLTFLVHKNKAWLKYPVQIPEPHR